MNDIKHVVWDWNGTLLDDIDVSMEALNTILKKAQLPLVLDKGEYRKYFQFPVIEYYKKVGFDFEKTPCLRRNICDIISRIVWIAPCMMA